MKYVCDCGWEKVVRNNRAGVTGAVCPACVEAMRDGR